MVLADARDRRGQGGRTLHVGSGMEKISSQVNERTVRLARESHACDLSRTKKFRFAGCSTHSLPATYNPQNRIDTENTEQSMEATESSIASTTHPLSGPGLVLRALCGSAFSVLKAVSTAVWG